jgi:LmbE family N-acetylglucosaminyl deacetylase
MSKTVLIVVAHPDDEVLGIGGTAARHALSGDEVHVIIVAEGLTSRAEDAGEGLGALHHAAGEAATILGCEPPILLGLPDNRLDTLALLDVIKPIETIINELQPAIVYTHTGSDLNVDHRVVHQAVVTACRPLPGSSVTCLYAFETVSSTEWATMDIGPAFKPTRYVNISVTLDRKMKALACYAAEMRQFPHARSMESVEALARLRGSQAALHAAEGFQVLFEIVNVVDQ